MDIETLKKDKVELEKQFEQAKAQLFRIQGAIYYIDQKITEASKDAKPIGD